MDKNSRIYIAGHRGLIGSAILRKYKKIGFRNFLVKTRKELDLMNQRKVEKFFLEEKPEYVMIAAGKIGGIKANMAYPAEFIYENVTVQNNIIWSSFKTNVKKLLYISCGCAYPTNSPQPIKETYLLKNIPEPTNEGFALAKILGIKLCEKINLEYKKNFISCIPANTFGLNDHYDESRSHVISALIKKFHKAKVENLPSVRIWGTGIAKREFIYVDDVADASVFLMDNFNPSKEEVGRGDVLINVGTGVDYSIAELADVVRTAVGYKGKIVWDTSKPNGMPRKLLDSSRLRAMGWRAKVHILDGIRRTYQWYLFIDLFYGI